MRRWLFLCLAGLALAASPAFAAVSLTSEDVSWTLVGTDMVRFQLHFHNDGSAVSGAASGTLYSQEFGAFMPHYGTIGTFNVPPIEPESFFDVFFEVPITDLPFGGGGGGGLATAAARIVPCPPPTWAGNVDVTWFEADPGGPIVGQVNKHFGVVGVCPGQGQYCIHLLTGCIGNITWAFRNVCPGWTVSLETEGHAPAPAQLPPGFTGWICVSANANVPVGSQCCFALDLTCLGVTATINVCAYACECPVPTIPETWGRLKTIYR
jgi:hypothetical protein